MILVVGCGFLGSYVVKCALENTDEAVCATVRKTEGVTLFDRVQYIRCDITDYDDVTKLYERTKNEKLTVFYLAACHNVDFVFKNPETAKKVNCDALENFFNTMRNIEKFFFASTDCVYGENGDVPKLSENSPLNPVNEYGRQKQEAEKIALSRGFTVTRLPFMLGPSLSDKPHFYDKICHQLKNNEKIEMIDGMRRSVLSYDRVAEILISLSQKDKLPQIINVCGDESYSKYELGCRIAQEIGVDASLVQKISEEQGSKFFKDKRASVSVMDNSLLKILLQDKC